MWKRLSKITGVEVEPEVEVEARGWVLTVRSQRDLKFISLTDGSTPKPLQVVVAADVNIPGIDDITTGCAIRVTGHLVPSPGKGQSYELQAKSIFLEGNVSDPAAYPIPKTNLSFEYLRNYAHLRGRTKTFSSIYRIRHRALMATHQFYDQHDFLLLDPNIITTCECEGGAGVFQLTEKDISRPSDLPLKESGEYDWKQDHFEKPVFLTVSSQLQLEALAMSMGSVYTMNKSFRSEHSNTYKHASEFTHLEIEQCFTSLEDLLTISEDYVKHVVKSILDSCQQELENLEASSRYNEAIDPKLMERYAILSKPFARIKYTDAVTLMRSDPKGLTKLPEFGQDIGSEHEKYLTDHFGGPVFLTHWPLSVKSFYMKQCADGSCESFDLLMPHVGELIGGSQRETDYHKLVQAMEAKGVSQEPLQFYLDLRRYGSCEHGGFGLGFDRLMMYLTGVKNIRDVTPFPVNYQSCAY